MGTSFLLHPFDEVVLSTQGQEWVVYKLFDYGSLWLEVVIFQIFVTKTFAQFFIVESFIGSPSVYNRGVVSVGRVVVEATKCTCVVACMVLSLYHAYMVLLPHFLH